MLTNTPNNYIVLKATAYILLISYTIAIAAYELQIGGTAASLVAKYYDYSQPIAGSPARVAIDAFPRDIYKNTKDTAAVLLCFSIISLLLVAASLIAAAIKDSRYIAVILAACANASAALPAFVLAAFLTWKVNSMSSEDINTWDSVDSRFISNLREMPTLLALTAIPGACWLCALCAAYILRSTSRD